MHALSRVLRPTAIGGVLSLLFGITLIFGSLSTRDAAGGSQQGQNYCGTPFSAAGVAPPTECPVGTITISKVAVGEGTVPDGGFTVVIDSDNCKLPGKAESISVLVSPGASKTVSDLYQYSGLLNSNERITCLYSVTEDAAPGWTTTYSPIGAVSLPQNDQSITNVGVTVTNTAIVTTPTPTPTPSTSNPTTSAPASSVAPSPSTSAPALASTGSSNTTPQLLLGGGLCLLGLVLIAGTRPKASHA